MEKLTINSTITLNNGVKMPVIGVGTYKTPEGEEVVNEVKWALEAGYRSIDTAKVYKNEEGVGKAIRESGIPRSELFVTTKLWNPDQGYESGLAAIDESLGKLGLDYVDLYLVHWPTASPDTKVSDNRRAETWRAMEEIYKSGKAKAIGVSNYSIVHLEEMKSYMTIPPTVNQVEFHPYLFQKELLDYCTEHKIVLEAYKPLTGAKLLENATVETLGKKYGKSIAQVLLRWSIQHGCIPIPKSIRKERIQENINIFDFELSAEDMKALDALNQNLRTSPDPTLLS